MNLIHNIKIRQINILIFILFSYISYIKLLYAYLKDNYNIYHYEKYNCEAI